MKKLLIALLLIGLIFVFSGCSQPKTAMEGGVQMVSDTKAWIIFGNQSKTIDVKEWYLGSGGYISITALDGTNYRTHSSNVLLVIEKED